MRKLRLPLVVLVLCSAALSASKPHVITLGKPMPVKLYAGAEEQQSIPIDVRPLYVDAKLKEYTTGTPHDVTDRVFVVRRAFRINDTLPEDPPKASKWLWQRGGWLLVDRSTGRISSIKLPDFDAFYSEVSWYRDYAAYCGIPEGTERVNALVAQIGTRKPIYKKELTKASGGDLPGSDCAPPHWERHPPRVTFLPQGSEKLTVNVKTRQADEPVDDSPEP